MVEEEAVWHEVAGVEDDGRQHVQEEDVGGEGRNGGSLRVEEQEADDDAQHHQHARLGEHVRQLGRHVEHCRRRHRC